MRKNRLLTATALSMTLAAFSLTGHALAATTISTATTAPVKTSVTGDLTVDSAGSITLTTGTAVTVDSDNDVTLNGKIDMAKSAAGSTGILVDGGRTADLTINAAITVTDDFTATDSVNTDTILDGPFADDKQRYGIHSTGTTPFIGNVEIKSGSTVTVSGQNSYGVRFENNVQGAFTMDGAIAMEGDNNKGVSLENGATGKVYLSGSIGTHGTGGSAVSLKGDFGSNVLIDGTYTGTGYATVDALNADALAKVLATPADLLQTGVLVDISGNVSKGILIGTTQANNVDTNTDANIDSNPDEDGDGTLDSSQSVANLANYGEAAALRVASSTQDLTIGGLEYASTAVTPPAYNYALSIRGNVSGNGVYSGRNALAVQLGGLGHAVNLANGVQISGTVSAKAVGATTPTTATAVLFASGATTPRLDVDGVVQATGTVSLTPVTSGTTTTYTVGPVSVVTVDIASGATLPIINVNKSSAIYATSVGSTNPTTIAIRDKSDTLTSITNRNVITASVSASDNDGDGVAEAITNPGIAIDTRTNTHGLTLTQIDVAPTDSDADKAISPPNITGDILLGSGDDVISVQGGSVTGAVDFGAGVNSFALSGKSGYIGKMTGAGTVALNVSEGTMVLLSGSKLNTTTVNVGATSTLAISLDTDHPTVPVLTGTGAVVFANGAKLNLTTNKLVTAPTTFKILTGSSIDLGNMATGTLDGFIPYLYHADLTKNTGSTELSANFRLKSQSEALFSDNQYAALTPVLSVLAGDAGATSQLLSQTNKEGFDRIFNQYLPDYSGENLLDLSLGSSSLTRSLGSLTLVPRVGGQYWIQEYGYHTERGYSDTAGFKSTGFSFAGGRESEIYGNQTIGVYLSYTSATPADTFAIAQEEMVNSDVTVGGYWRLYTGAFKGWAHAGVGYTNFESTRQSADLVHMSKAKWNGYSTSAGAGASVDYKLGGLGVTPTLLADYYSLKENARTETGGGSLFDLTVDERTSHLLSSTAMVNFSYGKGFIKPELWVGYKQNISVELANTTSHFGAAGTPFTLTGGNLEGGGPIAGFRLSADNEWSYFGLEGDYEKQDNYSNYSVALRTRFQF